MLFAAGMIGVMTGIRRDQFALSLNQRITSNMSLQRAIETNLNFASLQLKDTDHVWPVSVLMRHVLEEHCMKYRQAVHLLSHFPLMAPAYFIISGRFRDQGTVLIRDRHRLVSEQSLSLANGTWFVSVANADNWRDHRNLKAIAAMELMGRERVTPKNLFRVAYAVQQHTTIFTTIMSAKSYTITSTKSLEKTLYP